MRYLMAGFNDDLRLFVFAVLAAVALGIAAIGLVIAVLLRPEK